jgi:hypothetical protein
MRRCVNFDHARAPARDRNRSHGRSGRFRLQKNDEIRMSNDEIKTNDQMTKTKIRLAPVGLRCLHQSHFVSTCRGVTIR